MSELMNRSLLMTATIGDFLPQKTEKREKTVTIEVF